MSTGCSGANSISTLISTSSDSSSQPREQATTARVRGAPLAELPSDLYIPPGALKVFLEIFEGPLDLLTYLIRKHNLDILSIDVADIAEQYVAYIEMMQQMQFELAADYLSMAAWLTELKSRFLLPRAPLEGEEETEDPRAELIARVLAYEQIRVGAQSLDALPRLYREHYPSGVHPFTLDAPPPLPETNLREMLHALLMALKREKLFTRHMVSGERYSTKDRISYIRRRLEDLQSGEQLRFLELFSGEESRAGLVVTLVAILELANQHELRLLQHSDFGEIYLQAA